jgi:aminoglycoside phosphotransferase (APT) family kinase protein
VRARFDPPAATDITTELLLPLLRELNRAEPVEITAMTGGSSPTWRIDLADGAQLVLKGYADAARWRNGKEAFAAAQVEHLPIPMTRYLLIDDSGRRLPFPFSLSHYLPGATLKSFAGHPDYHGGFRQVGTLLRQLHGVKMPGYGAFGAEGIVNARATNADYIGSGTVVCFARFRQHGADAMLADWLEQLVADRFDAIVPHSASAVFAHDDIQPNNVLFVEQGALLHLSGLIDFGNAHAQDAVMDLAKTLFCCEHEAPGSSAAILAGYGPIDHPDPEAALGFYTLLHRVTMWTCLRHAGFIATPDAPSNLIDDLWAMAG